MATATIAFPRTGPEETFVLDGQVYSFGEQDWSHYPEAARAALRETNALLFTYWTALIAHKPICEGGVKVEGEALRRRVLELIGGIWRLAPLANFNFHVVVNGLLCLPLFPIGNFI